MSGAESIVYGCIRDTVFTADREQTQSRRQVNRQVLRALPSIEDWPLLSREMFASPLETIDYGDLRTDVMHFGSSYRAVEYEWEQWLARFEDVLARMYWVSATVHLETELNGTHTFVWLADGDFHRPSDGPLNLRCEWTRESLGF